MKSIILALSVLLIGMGASASENFNGVGIILSQKDALTRIEGTLKGSPAESAGVQPQEIIKAVDNVSIVGADLKTVIAAIRGQAATQVVLTIADSQNLHERNLTMIRVPIIFDCFMEGTIQLMGNGSVSNDFPPTMITGTIGGDTVSMRVSGGTISALFKGESLNLDLMMTRNTSTITGWVHGQQIRWTGSGNNYFGYQTCIQ